MRGKAHAFDNDGFTVVTFSYLLCHYGRAILTGVVIDRHVATLGGKFLC